MDKYKIMVSELVAELDHTTKALEEKSAEVRTLAERASRLQRAVEAMQAVADVSEDSRALAPRKIALIEAARLMQIRDDPAQTGGSVRDKVLAVLRTQLRPLTRVEVVERLRLLDDNVNDSTVASTLSKLVGSHGVKKNDENGYFIEHKEEEPSTAALGSS